MKSIKRKTYKALKITVEKIMFYTLKRSFLKYVAQIPFNLILN